MKKALIVVDIQNDFCKGGSLEVPSANEIIPLVNKLTKDNMFDLVIFTKDWHPVNHKSFASQHKDKNVFDMVKLNGIDQVMWPDHCIDGTFGAEIHKDVDLNIPNLYIFKKGMNLEVDSYSGFYDNDKKTSTGLSEFLKEKGIEATYITGLATDYCIKYTAIDSSTEGFETYVIWDACRGISEDLSPVMNEMFDSGVNVIDYDYLKIKN